jgi:hypothetical protein
MILCTSCLHVDDRRIAHCPACGETAFAGVTKNGDLVSVPAAMGMPCQSCLRTERELRLRYYRRVLGLLIMDQVWAEAGYFCGSCRRRHFGKNMAFTLVLGWWGVLAMLFRNPYAIVVNLWALLRPPFGAGMLGAMNANEIRAAAAKDHERELRLADVYMRMPGWMETLSEDDIDCVLANVDYYEVLGASHTASHREIKAAWRELVKTHHPDHVGDAGNARIVSINGAWHVLGDERRRHAYDHRDELLAFLQDAEAVASEFDEADGDDDLVMVVGCTECRIGFESFDDAADHVDAVHPHTDYQDILVSLVEDEDDAAADSEGAAERDYASVQWRCKACPATFADYDAALDHADRAHPDRTSIDPRSAVEAI